MRISVMGACVLCLLLGCNKKIDPGVGLSGITETRSPDVAEPEPPIEEPTFESPQLFSTVSEEAHVVSPIAEEISVTPQSPPHQCAANGSPEAFPRNVVLWYFNRGLMTDAAAKRLVRYENLGANCIDRMFEGILLGDTKLHYTPSYTDRTGVYHAELPVTEASVLQFSNNVFAALGALAAAVRPLRQLPGYEKYRLSIYLWIPWPTSTDGTGTETSALKELAARFDVEKARWPELRLRGFYWGYQELATTAEQKRRIRTSYLTVKNELGSSDYEFLYIPSNHLHTGIQDVKTLGAIRTTVQPNYLQSRSEADKNRLAIADRICKEGADLRRGVRAGSA